MNKDLLYWIPAGQYGKEGVLSLLAQHPKSDLYRSSESILQAMIQMRKFRLKYL